MARLLVL
ncbi:hypothetical protein Patl1_35972 [Pistacia atlantica]|nr:hypothetical protein Patl1_37544 [Pistacia atlantica]KAJ0076506.1 hypothetical protein Patl1_35942 [Pistacia atlantica]KAJ0076953.1 hypothetical protein Patl1_35972 [Pistacia atlantica]